MRLIPLWLTDSIMIISDLQGVALERVIGDGNNFWLSWASEHLLTVQNWDLLVKMSKKREKGRVVVIVQQVRLLVCMQLILVQILVTHVTLPLQEVIPSCKIGIRPDHHWVSLLPPQKRIISREPQYSVNSLGGFPLPN